ncbi:hypothetical protein [Kocuria sp. CPCC 205297]|uniref:hypothetical protein n=1 Tax=Kocuria sp. CPCC 205297 TaxID=3073558 RepID=UPI0034D63356
MKRPQKILTLGSAALLSASLLVGCGNTTQNQAPAQNDATQGAGDATAAATGTTQDAATPDATGASPSDTASATDSASPSDSASPTSSASGSASPSGSASGAAVNGGQAAALAAVDSALARHQGGDVVEIDYDRRADKFEVDLIADGNAHQVTVDATGKDVQEDRADGRADEDDVAELRAAAVGAKDAIKRVFESAESESGTKVLDEASLDEDDDVVRWEVELDIDNRDKEYTVNVQDGSVTAR